MRCGAVFRNRKTYCAVLGAVSPHRKTYVARCGCKFMLTRLFYPSTSSTPSQCPCRFFLVERYKRCGFQEDKHPTVRFGAVRLLCLIATRQSDVVTGQAPITMKDVSRKKCDVLLHTIYVKQKSNVCPSRQDTAVEKPRRHNTKRR